MNRCFRVTCPNPFILGHIVFLVPVINFLLWLPFTTRHTLRSLNRCSYLRSATTLCAHLCSRYASLAKRSGILSFILWLRRVHFFINNNHITPYHVLIGLRGNAPFNSLGGNSKYRECLLIIETFMASVGHCVE